MDLRRHPIGQGQVGVVPLQFGDVLVQTGQQTFDDGNGIVTAGGELQAQRVADVAQLRPDGAWNTRTM